MRVLSLIFLLITPFVVFANNDEWSSSTDMLNISKIIDIKNQNCEVEIQSKIKSDDLIIEDVIFNDGKCKTANREEINMADGLTEQYAKTNEVWNMNGYIVANTKGLIRTLKLGTVDIKNSTIRYFDGDEFLKNNSKVFSRNLLTDEQKKFFMKPELPSNIIKYGDKASFKSTDCKCDNIYKINLHTNKGKFNFER